MPIVTVTLLPAYPAEVEQRLVQRLARTTRSVIAAPSSQKAAFFISWLLGRYGRAQNDSFGPR